MEGHLYQNFAEMTDAAFGAGIQSSVASGLAATSGPLTSLLVIYVVLTGWLIMRGDLALRPGIFRVVRAGGVVMLVSASYYNTYVRDLFLTGLPSWIAGTMTSGGVAITVPQQLDLVRSATLHLSAAIYQNTGIENLDLRVQAGMADGAVTLLLGAADFVYVVAHAFMGLAVCVGPFIAAAWLFDATKPIVEGWIGKLVSLSILTLLVSIVAQIVVKQDSLYIRNLAGNIGGVDIREQVENLWSLVCFFGLCTVLLVGLPGLAYSIGRGIAINTNLAGWWGAPARALDRIRVPSLSWRGR